MTTELSLSEIIGEMRSEGDALIAKAPRNWRQGRTAYGGLTAALMLEATLRQQDDLPPLRSALVNFTGPVTDDPHLTSRLLRRGRNMTMVSTSAQIGEQVVGDATFSFGAAQDSRISVDCPAPEAPAPEDCEPLIPPIAAAMAPGFHRSFDIQLIEGDRPMMGSTRPYLRCWARHRDPASRDGIVSLMCIADILPPGVFPLFPKLGPNSSVNWICNFLTETPETDDGWWQAETSATAARNGYSSQVMRIWNSRGELVVEGMQSVVVFV